MEQLTAKSVRQKLEEMMGLASGALKPKKQEISDLIDECIEEQDVNHLLYRETTSVHSNWPMFCRLKRERVKTKARTVRRRSKRKKRSRRRRRKRNAQGRLPLETTLITVKRQQSRR